MLSFLTMCNWEIFSKLRKTFPSNFYLRNNFELLIFSNPSKLVCEFKLLPDAKNSSMAISSTGKYVRNAEKIRDSTCFDPLNPLYGIIIMSAILVMLLMCCCSTLGFIFTLKKKCLACLAKYSDGNNNSSRTTNLN